MTVIEYRYPQTYIRKDGTTKTTVKVVKYTPPHPRWSDDELNEMHRLFDMGVKKNRICADFGICYPTLTRILKTKQINV